MTGDGNNLSLQADVERIVRQVLADMRQRSSTRGTASGELVLSGKVVSLAEVEGRLDGVSRVVADRGAVFTPAARDELKRRNVVVASHVRPGKPTHCGSMTLGIAETKSDPRVLAAALRSEGIQVEGLAETQLVGVVDRLCQCVLGGRLGLLMTGQTAAALCLANRQHGVRAALGTNVSAIAAAKQSIGANLLVIDPNGRSVFELRHLAREWLRGESRGCPPIWRERLG